MATVVSAPARSRRPRLSAAAREKDAAARAALQRLGSVVVAFSGGVDSALVVQLAGAALPGRVLAVTARSETYPRREIDAAGELARQLGVAHMVIDTAELADERFARNDAQRCYWCKHELFSALAAIARERGFAAVVDGASADDAYDYRPGQRAARELGVRSPLREAGFTKQEIRQVSRWYGLPTADKPSLACLASRVAYGEPITAATAALIDAAEEAVRACGVKQVRVRHHGALARIEVFPAAIARLAAPRIRRQLCRQLAALGYTYVTLDLAGYRTGSMNAVLPPATVAAHQEPSPGSGAGKEK